MAKRDDEATVEEQGRIKQARVQKKEDGKGENASEHKDKKTEERQDQQRQQREHFGASSQLINKSERDIAREGLRSTAKDSKAEIEIFGEQFKVAKQQTEEREKRTR